MAETTKYVNWDGLTYYDSKIKQYIDGQVVELEANTANKAEFNALSQQVSALITADSNQDIHIDNLREQMTAVKANVDILTSKAQGHATRLEHIETTQANMQDSMVKRHELSEYAKTEQVDKKIEDAIKITTVDLTDYYTKGEVDANVSNLRTEVVSNTTNVDNIYKTVETIQEATMRDHELLEGLLTSVENKSEEGHKHNLTDIVDFVAPDLSNYATKEQLQGVATQDFVRAEIAKAELGDVDAANFYTKTETDLKLDSKVDNTQYQVDKTRFVTVDQLDAYVSDEELDVVSDSVSELAATIDQQALVVHDLQQDLGAHEETLRDIDTALASKLDAADYEEDKVNFAFKTDLASFASKDYVDASVKNVTVDLSGYATEEFVTKKIAEAELSGSDVDLTAYYTKSEVDKLIPDLTGYATEQYVAETIAGLEQPEVDLSSYYTKEETYSKEQVDTAIANIEHPDVPTKVSDLDNDANYTTLEAVAQVGYITNVDDKLDKAVYDADKTTFAVKTDLNNYYDKTTVDKKFEEIEHPTVDLEGYATEQWVNDQGFLKEHQSLDGYAKLTDIPDTSKFITEIPSDYITETELESKGYLTEHQSLDGYAKTTDIPDVSNFVTMSQVEAKGYITEVPEEYITSTELEQEGFLKEHQDLSEYAKKTDIPSLTGYATKQYVEDAIAEIPDVDTSMFITNDALAAALITKANNVVFTEDMRVGTALGQFAEKESLKDLTLAQILTKLLNLTAYVPPTPDIELPEGTPETVVEVVANKAPAYVLDENGSPVAVTDESDFYRELTAAEAKIDNQEESYFYQIVDDTTGELLESGYHVSTIYQENDYLTVLIPNTITKFHVEEYSALAGDWSQPTWELVANPTYDTIDGYTAYTVNAEIMSGIAVRIVIEE